jgi:multidrug efflux pump
MGGIVGRLLREFALTLSVAVLVSLVLSLTTTPMMCARLLRHEPERGHGWLYHACERFFNGLLARYERSLAWALRHSRLMLLVMLGTVALNVYLFLEVPKGFFPQQDNGRIMGSIQADQSISFQAMEQKLQTFVEIVHNDPAVSSVVGFTGGSEVNSGRMFISLRPLEERKLSADQVIARLRAKLAHVAGATLLMQAAQDIRVGGRQSQAQYQYTLQADNFEDLLSWEPRILQALQGLPQLTDVNTDLQNKGLQASLLIDRASATKLGITMALIDATLYDAFGQRQVSVIYDQRNQYHVIMGLAPQYWQSPETLKRIYLKSASGAMVPLSAIAHFETKTTTLSVNHQGQFAAITLSFNLLPGAVLSDAVNAINSAVAKLQIPNTIHGSFQGTAQVFQSSLATEPLLILAALVTIYLVLGILYESLVHPITILSTLPSAGVGALLALLATGTELSLIALIGIVLLIGIVKKNAIMMIDFALIAEREQGLSSAEAIYQACRLRFRPIMMTTMAAMLGALPLALGTGTGSELRRPLGIAIVGGLMVSQLLTLYTTPVVYLYLDRFRLWCRRQWGRPALVEAAG